MSAIATQPFKVQLESVDAEVVRLEDRMEPFLLKGVEPPAIYARRYELVTQAKSALLTVTATIAPLLQTRPDCLTLPSVVSLAAAVGVYLLAGDVAVRTAMYGRVQQALDAVQEEAKAFGVSLQRLHNAEALLVENRASREAAEGRLADARASAETTVAQAQSELKKAEAAARKREADARERESQANEWAA
ncbi:MAG: hypothetical protein LBF24_04055 [Puniceicoccales bacterium]|nr:hypothetical protein [Puniceicoccales bacterium]